MSGAICMLFEMLKRRFPYEPDGQTEAFYSAQADKIYQQLRERYPELKHELWTHRDCLECLEHYQSLHYFTLGLSIGLSVGQELPSLTETQP